MIKASPTWRLSWIRSIWSRRFWYKHHKGCFPLCQRFRKFRSEIKWNGQFRFLPTGIFGITSGGGPLISVGIFRPKFAVPFLTNRFFALIREFGKGIKSGKSHSYRLARFNRKMSFHFPSVFPLICDRSVWHNGKHPKCPFTLLPKFNITCVNKHRQWMSPKSPHK